MHWATTIKFAFYIFVSVILTGCATDYQSFKNSSVKLMKRPNLYSPDIVSDIFSKTPDIYKKNPVDVFFITDRFPKTDKNGDLLTYVPGRNTKIAIGTAAIEFGTCLDWASLAKISQEKPRSQNIVLKIKSINNIAESPDVPRQIFEKKYAKQTGNHNAYQSAFDDMIEKMNAHLLQQMSVVNRREVFLFVHGINTTFEQGLTDWTQVWHYMGREGVPLIYCWPAGLGGIKSYFVDSDTGDASVEHMKGIIKVITRNPMVEKLSIIAHSRGCDIASRTLIELAIENKARGNDAGSELKLNNVILIAPDVAESFFSQRVVANDVLEMPEHFTIYMTEHDRALGLSQWLRAGLYRMGAVKVADITKEVKDAVELFKKVSLVVSQAKAQSWTNHSYYIESPSVSSDLMLLLRYNLLPGKDFGRPLKSLSNNIWILEEGYPFSGYKLPNTDY